MAEKKTATKKQSIDTIKLQNGSLDTVLVWLNVPLHSKEAIARNRIVEIISEKVKQLEKDRMSLIEKYGERDKENNLIIITDEETKKTHYKLKDKEKFNEDFKALLDTEIIFDILPSNRDYWKTVKNIWENTKVEMDIETTTFYEEILKRLSI